MIRRGKQDPKRSKRLTLQHFLPNSIKFRHYWVVEIRKSNAIYSAENDTHRKSFSVMQESSRVIKQVAKHHLRLVVLILSKSSRLLRTQKSVIKLAKEPKVFAGRCSDQSVWPHLTAKFVLFRT